MMVTRPDQKETSNIEEVCEFWKDEFVKVYNPELNENFDDEFYRWAKTYRQFLEQNYFTVNCNDNDTLFNEFDMIELLQPIKI